MTKGNVSLIAFVIFTAVSWVHPGIAEAPVALENNPIEVQGDGASLYGSKCSACHGKNGAGLPNWRSKGQPDLTNSEWQESHTDTEIADTIKNGKGKLMPPFKNKMSDEDVSAIVSWIRMLKKK